MLRLLNSTPMHRRTKTAGYIKALTRSKIRGISLLRGHSLTYGANVVLIDSKINKKMPRQHASRVVTVDLLEAFWDSWAYQASRFHINVRLAQKAYHLVLC